MDTNQRTKIFKKDDINAPRCKCGCRMVCNDGHYICERYLEQIKKGVNYLNDIIDELEQLNGA